MANFDLSKLMEGKNPQAVMLNETRQLKGKWEQTGLLEGLNTRFMYFTCKLKILTTIFLWRFFDQ